MSRFGLRFSQGATESDYQRWRIEVAIPFTRVGMIASAIAWLVAAGSSWATVSDTFFRAAPTVFFLVLPMCLAGLAVTYVPRLRSSVMPMTALLNCIAGVAAIWLLHEVYGVPGAASGASIMAAYFAFTIFRLPPILASLAAAPYTFLILYLLAIDHHELRLGAAENWAYMLMPIIASITGLLVCGVLEHITRQVYANEQIIAHQQQALTQRTIELQHEQIRAKELLHNILPVRLAEELSTTGSARPARHESVTILFTDFSGFTQAVSTMPADRMVAELNEIFAAFDDITDECAVEKIKTIGDAYMAAAGLPEPCADHAQRCVRAGLRMVDYLEHRNRTAAFKWSVRVGIHSGPAVAGVVGKRKYAFDVWGDTVNIASRMESSGEIGRVNVSAYTFDLIRKDFECEYRGKMDAKGKGQIDMYFVTGTRQS